MRRIAHISCDLTSDGQFRIEFGDSTTIQPDLLINALGHMIAELSKVAGTVAKDAGMAPDDMQKLLFPPSLKEVPDGPAEEE